MASDYNVAINTGYKHGIETLKGVMNVINAWISFIVAKLLFQLLVRCSSAVLLCERFVKHL